MAAETRQNRMEKRCHPLCPGVSPRIAYVNVLADTKQVDLVTVHIRL